MPPLAQPLLNEITAKVAAIEGADAASAGPHWGAMHKLLLKAKVDPAAIMRLVGARDVKELKRVAARLRGEEVAEDVVAPAPAAVAVDASVMQSALKIFRRRVKFAQLDAESKLGVGPMSGGAQHKIDAMIPPREFPMHVWEALVHAGKLRREGDGFTRWWMTTAKCVGELCAGALKFISHRLLGVVAEIYLAPVGGIGG